MFFLAINGETETGATIEDQTTTVSLDINPESMEPEWRCETCGEELTETGYGGFETENGDAHCPHDDSDDDAEPAEPHEPEPVALSWCNGASISTDQQQDSVTVTISAGDPRGGFALTVRRIPADARGPLAGRLVAHVPYEGELMPHMPMKRIHDGTYLLGS